MSFDMETWAAYMQRKVRDENQSLGITEKTKVFVNPSRKTKYAKVVIENSGKQRVLCFIERSTGNIYKPVSSTGAGKHVQGDINDPDGSWKHAVDPYASTYAA